MKYTETSKSGNVRYVIDTDNKIIRAILLCDRDEPQIIFRNKIKRYIRGEGKGPVEKQLYIEKYRIDSVYEGIAKCHPDDEFNIDFGKRLSLLRAKEKYIRAISTKLYEMDLWIEKLHDISQKLRNKHYRILIDNGCELYNMEKESGLYE